MKKKYLIPALTFAVAILTLMSFVFRKDDLKQIKDTHTNTLSKSPESSHSAAQSTPRTSSQTPIHSYNTFKESAALDIKNIETIANYPTPEPIPVFEEDSDYFKMIPEIAVPTDYLIPKFKVIYNDDPQKAQYFTIKFENAQEYRNREPAEYNMTLICVSHKELNFWQQPAPNGTPGEIVDITINRNLGIILSILNGEVYLYALPAKYYTTYADAVNFQIKPGMKLLFRIAFTKNGLTTYYYKNITVPDMPI